MRANKDHSHWEGGADENEKYRENFHFSCFDDGTLVIKNPGHLQILPRGQLQLVTLKPLSPWKNTFLQGLWSATLKLRWIFLLFYLSNAWARGGGALNFGLHAMCHQKDPTFFRSLSPKDPHFYQLSPNDPLFLTKSLSPKDADTSLSHKDPSNFVFNSQTSDNFRQKLDFSTNLRKCWEIFGYFLMHFTERPPIFVHFVTERPPFLTQFVTKNPYIWGAWRHSYVTFVCEYPPGM